MEPHSHDAVPNQRNAEDSGVEKLTVGFTGRFAERCKLCRDALLELESATSEQINDLARSYLSLMPSRKSVSLQPAEVEIDFDADDISKLVSAKDEINAAEKICVQTFLQGLNERFGAFNASLETPLNLSGIAVTDLYGSNIDLRGAIMTEAVLPLANFYDANLARTDLRSACLNQATLRGNFDFADLREADLRTSIFAWGSAIGADLRNADLRSAVLYSQDFSGAKLNGAMLDMVELEDETSFAGVSGAKEIQLDGKIINGLMHRKPTEVNGYTQLVRHDTVMCQPLSLPIRRALIVEDAVIDLLQPKVKGEMVLLIPEDQNISCFYMDPKKLGDQLGE